MFLKFLKFFRQIICIRYNINSFFSKNFLHIFYVCAHPILSSKFITIWKMIDFLIFVQCIIKRRLIGCATPEYIPIVILCLLKIVLF